VTGLHTQQPLRMFHHAGRHDMELVLRANRAAMLVLLWGALVACVAGWMLLTAIAIQAGYLLGVIAREYAANFPHVDWRSILRWRHNTRL
jgi:hypothetical protein